MIPVALAEFAVDAAKKEWPDSPDMRRFFVSSYCEAFLDVWRYGSRAGEIGISKKVQSGFVGYEAGMRARQNELKDLEITPAHFGYKVVSVEGVYKYNTEISHFIEETTGEKFHLNPGAVEVMPKTKVRISAWVSPEAKLFMGPGRSVGFGHMGWCNRELIPIRVESEQP